MKKMMAIVEVSAAHGGVAAELAGVGNEEGGPAVGDDGLTRLHLAGVKIEQRAILVDAADTENPDISLEAREETHRCVADDIAVKRT